MLHEEYAGNQLMKLPGGGLEFGEGVLECLHREFEEELNVKIKIINHLYTQEEFVVSRFRDNEQLLTIYYQVEIIDEKVRNNFQGFVPFTFVDLRVMCTHF